WRPLVQRLAAKRHHDSGKSGQCDRDLGGGREGFTWFHRFGLDRIQGTQTNTKFGRVDCLRQFETRSLPALSRSYPRHFTFYVAHPIRSSEATGTCVPQPFGLSAALVRNWSSLFLNRM